MQLELDADPIALYIALLNIYDTSFSVLRGTLRGDDLFACLVCNQWVLGE